MKKVLFTICALMICALVAKAKILMPQMFQSGMVLQRNKPIAVWGNADKGERVVITFNKKKYSTTADNNGKWRINMPKMKAGGPYIMDISSGEGQPGTTIDNILIGDVWLCSGQSNIDVTVERVHPQYPKEIDEYKNNKIRLFRVLTDYDTHGSKDNVKSTSWKEVDKNNAWNFSAIGYFLGKLMYQRNGVPQGVICNSLGGTPIESWVDMDSLRQDFPMYYQQTRLYQNDEMIAAQAKANQLANNQWFDILNDTDPGVKQQWTTLAYDDSKWKSVNQYDKLTEGYNYIGSLWMRQHINVDAKHAGKKALMLLGTLYDQDYTYVNGREVGRTYYQYPPRRYEIPEGLLKEGDNVITIRFVNKSGTPHFIKQKPYEIIFGESDTVQLSQQWLLSEGTTMPACPSGGGANIQNLPSVLYNAMLYPLHPYAMQGVVWYQGESNTGRAKEYAPLLNKLTANWRALWNDPKLPFVIVQLANFMEPSANPQNSGWSELREAQRTVAKQDPYAELAVAIDLGETVDIHPLRKKEVAERIALGFDKQVFGKKVGLSPEVTASTTDGNKVVLTFDRPLNDGSLYEFELCGTNGKYVNAQATAKGRTVTITSSTVTTPTAVRYAWKNNPINANCRATDGLPASPFELKLDTNK